MNWRKWWVILWVLLWLTGCAGNETAVQSPTASPAPALTPSATFAAVAVATPVEHRPVATSVATATELPAPPSLPTDTPVPAETVVMADDGTPVPTATQTALPTETATATPAGPQAVNGIPFADFVDISPEVAANIQAIYAAGQNLGRNPYRLSRLGDSTIMKPNFMSYFDEGKYDLGEYGYLQPVIDQFTGSFQRVGVAARVGLHAWGVLDPFWSYKQWCNEDEHMLDCEFRYNNPVILFIRLGTNDGSDSFEANLRKVVAYTISQGVIPILGTKPDRFEGDDSNNDAIRQAAADYLVPLWDFDLVASTIPGKGLDEDNVHLLVRYEPHDFNDPETFMSGHAIQDLTALIVLNDVWRLVNPPATE